MSNRSGSLDGLLAAGGLARGLGGGRVGDDFGGFGGLLGGGLAALLAESEILGEGRARRGVVGRDCRVIRRQAVAGAVGVEVETVRRQVTRFSVL
ncbi:hypothetical protein GCM10007887_07190 [Methylobacterium haplocladii]|nr:hypothetical protein GCM10007887_07190 [Methylobacterium haplocladii]